MNSDEQPCGVIRLQALHWQIIRDSLCPHADTEVLGKLGALSFEIEQREKMITQLSFI